MKKIVILMLVSFVFLSCEGLGRDFTSYKTEYYVESAVCGATAYISFKTGDSITSITTTLPFGFYLNSEIDDMAGLTVSSDYEVTATITAVVDGEYTVYASETATGDIYLYGYIFY